LPLLELRLQLGDLLAQPIVLVAVAEARRREDALDRVAWQLRGRMQVRCEQIERHHGAHGGDALDAKAAATARPAGRASDQRLALLRLSHFA